VDVLPVLQSGEDVQHVPVEKLKVVLIADTDQELVTYEGLPFRAQYTIELNFRDAKQHWGLEDFMYITPTGVTNAANLSLFMVNVSYRL
jgi:putative transposase